MVSAVLCGDYEIVKIPWVPKQGDTWYAYGPDGVTSLAFQDDNLTDLFCWKNGLMYRTREEAETKGKQRYEELKAEYERALDVE